MTGQVLKSFVIRGNGKIQDVGARPRIYELANKSGVKVFPRNVEGNNVEVVVEGKPEDIEWFHQYVKEADLQKLLLSEKKNGYEVHDLVDFKGDNEPDFGYFASSSTMEQVSKGTEYLKSIDSKLAKLDKLDKLDTLPDDLAKAMVKVLKKEEE